MGPKHKSAPEPTPKPQVKYVAPVYPQIAKLARVQGTVRIAIRVDADGKVQIVKVISGNPILVQAAIEAVQQWQYAPGNARETTVEVPFVLNDPKFETAAWRQFDTEYGPTQDRADKAFAERDWQTAEREYKKAAE